MKRLIALAFLLTVIRAFAQVPVLSPDQIERHFGFSRITYCATGAGEGCGSNPPTKQLTVKDCGNVISTSTARNEDGSSSTEGILYLLPTVQQMTDAGFFTGPVGSQRSTCFISFVMALPLPSSYARIGLHGVQGVDKLTFEYEGTFHDIHWGDVPFPAIGSAQFTVAFNRTSWLLYSGAPAIAAYLGYGSMASQGQGRLFVVTQDPPGWSVGSKIGSIAFCRKDGMGITTPSNGGVALNMIPSTCVFTDSSSGSLTYLMTLRHFGTFTANGIAQGAAYAAGTAQNGTAYPAGSYIVLTGVSAVNFANGDQVRVHNVKTTLGSKANGKWIAKQLTGPTTGCPTTGQLCYELHEEVRDESDMNNTASHVGPPSAFVAGDTLSTDITAPFNAGSYEALVAVSTSGGGARRTNPATGSEEDTVIGGTRSVVGLVRTVSGAFVDTDSTRYVASWFNPVERRVRAVSALDRTTASATFVEANSDLRANFVYLSHVSAYAGKLGDLGRRVRYEPTITLSNDTAGGGCFASIGFDSTTPETEVVQMLNPTGVTNIPHTLSLSGTKQGLTEGANPHYSTVLIRTNGIGTCKLWKDYTFNTAYVWQ